MNGTQMARLSLIAGLSLLAAGLQHAAARGEPVVPDGQSLDDAVITLTDGGFEPSVITVTVGTTVIWRNETAAIRNLASGTPFRVYLPYVLTDHGEVAGTAVTTESDESSFGGTLAPGGELEHLFATAGSYPFFIRERPDWVGRVDVVEPSATPTPTPTHAPTATETPVPTPTPTEMPAPFSLSSTAFEEGGAIPTKYTYRLPGQCNGQNFSPPLVWMGVPAGTVSFAIIMVDPDGGDWVHWVQFDIPGDATGLPEAIAAPDTGVKGINDFRELGYGGPCPPSGTHTYVFTLYALDATLSLPEGATKAQAEAAMAGHILGQARLTGRRSRS